MKKLIFLIIITLSVSTSAFAAPSATGVSSAAGLTLRGTSPATLDIGRSSKGVVYGWTTSATGYAINTYHTSGTKVYGTAYDSTALFFMDVGTGATLAAPTSSDSTQAFPSGTWTTM